MAAETQQEVGQAMSLPIQDVLDTINLQNIDASVAMYHNEHYILGFPSTRGANGGALHPNAAVAYNLADPELVRGVELGTDLLRAPD